MNSDMLWGGTPCSCVTTVTAATAMIVTCEKCGGLKTKLVQRAAAPAAPLPQWTLTQNHLPENARQVLTAYLYAGTWIKFIGYYMSDYESDPVKTGWWNDSDEFMGDKITHWTELPADPTRERPAKAGE